MCINGLIMFTKHALNVFVYTSMNSQEKSFWIPTTFRNYSDNSVLLVKKKIFSKGSM